MTVGTGQLRRVGDYVCEDTRVLNFQNGLLCGVTDGSPTCVYLCCSSTGSTPPSAFVGRIVAESVGRQPEFFEYRQRFGPE